MYLLLSLDFSVPGSWVFGRELGLTPLAFLVLQLVGRLGLKLCEQISVINLSIYVYTVVPPYRWFHFPRFQLPVLNCGPKMLNGKF